MVDTFCYETYFWRKKIIKLLKGGESKKNIKKVGQTMVSMIEEGHVSLLTPVPMLAAGSTGAHICCLNRDLQKLSMEMNPVTSLDELIWIYGPSCAPVWRLARTISRGHFVLVNR